MGRNTLIERRRRQILIHSCIYYEFNDNILEDYQYDAFAKELKQLVKDNPKEAQQALFNDEFKQWDKSDCPSGYDLPYNNAWVRDKAIYLMRLRDEVYDKNREK